MAVKPLSIRLSPVIDPEQIHLTLQGVTAARLRVVGEKQGLTLEETAAQILEAVVQMQLVESGSKRAGTRSAKRSINTPE